MTEEYKEILFDYITGNITTTSSSTDEIFQDLEVWNTDLLSQLPAGTTSYTINGLVANNDATSQVYALYGWCNNGGFIVILDTDFSIVQVITTFSSGTAFRDIYCLQVNTEDNTFYGVDYNGTTPRFIMLNNFLIPDENNNYTVKLRTSYNFTDTNFDPAFMQMAKSPTNSHYVMIGTYHLVPDDTGYIKIVELKVNVGQANEWTSYTNGASYGYNLYVEFDTSDNAYIQTIINPSGDTTKLAKLYKNFTATTLTTTNLLTLPTNYTLTALNSVANISKNEFYYSVSYDGDYRLYNYNNGTNTLIKQDTSLNGMGGFKVKVYNGQLYIFYNKAVANYVRGQGYYFRYNGTWSPIKVRGLDNLWALRSDLYIDTRYNLQKIFIYGQTQGGVQQALITEDYNPSNYNSTPYIDGTAIYPQKCRLYSSGELVFARNDYNVSSLGNTYTTTVEVPNVYLNSGSIQPNQLISKTNQIIVSDITPINKNIYEKVYINFINSINSYDEDTGNNFDTTTLVKNISGLGDTYTNSYIGYWNTTLNGTVVDSGTIDSYTYLGRLTGQFDLSFTPSGVADRLNFLDNNGNIYAWIDISNCVVGTTYDISQKVRLADIPLGNQHVVWNDNHVQFNGNSVVYYTSI